MRDTTAQDKLTGCKLKIGWLQQVRFWAGWNWGKERERRKRGQNLAIMFALLKDKKNCKDFNLPLAIDINSNEKKKRCTKRKKKSLIQKRKNKERRRLTSETRTQIVQNTRRGCNLIISVESCATDWKIYADIKFCSLSLSHYFCFSLSFSLTLELWPRALSFLFFFLTTSKSFFNIISKELSATNVSALTAISTQQQSKPFDLIQKSINWTVGWSSGGVNQSKKSPRLTWSLIVTCLEQNNWKDLRQFSQGVD